LLRGSFQQALDHSGTHIDRSHLAGDPSKGEADLSGSASKVDGNRVSLWFRVFQHDLDHLLQPLCTFMLPRADSLVPEVPLVAGRGGGYSPMRCDRETLRRSLGAQRLHAILAVCMDM
jgi:hypothetical protein